MLRTAVSQAGNIIRVSVPPRTVLLLLPLPSHRTTYSFALIALSLVQYLTWALQNSKLPKYCNAASVTAPSIDQKDYAMLRSVSQSISMIENNNENVYMSVTPPNQTKLVPSSHLNWCSASPHLAPPVVAPHNNAPIHSMLHCKYLHCLLKAHTTNGTTNTTTGSVDLEQYSLKLL